jgi:hypothetical protein
MHGFIKITTTDRTVLQEYRSNMVPRINKKHHRHYLPIPIGCTYDTHQIEYNVLIHTKGLVGYDVDSLPRVLLSYFRLLLPETPSSQGRGGQRMPAVNKLPLVRLICSKYEIQCSSSISFCTWSLVGTKTARFIGLAVWLLIPV